MAHTDLVLSHLRSNGPGELVRAIPTLRDAEEAAPRSVVAAIRHGAALREVLSLTQTP